MGNSSRKSCRGVIYRLKGGGGGGGGREGDMKERVEGEGGPGNRGQKIEGMNKGEGG